MACENYQEQVSRLIDNELGEHESPTLFGHLGTCAECRRFLHAMLKLRSGLQGQSPILAPADLDEKVLGAAPTRRRFAPDRSAVRSFLWKRRISLPVPVAAVVVVLLMLCSILISSSWLGGAGPDSESQTVYVTVLPAVEVRGQNPQPETTIQ
ncbi:MAG: hypothetical protein FJ217_06105 [Ignavibacteria bacterium]|nr:hypothetical protein [Ignavibacteria bacterium]